MDTNKHAEKAKRRFVRLNGYNGQNDGTGELVAIEEVNRVSFRWSRAGEKIDFYLMISAGAAREMTQCFYLPDDADKLRPVLEGLGIEEDLPEAVRNSMRTAQRAVPTPEETTNGHE